MTTEKIPWFVSERSEAFAGLLLTSRKDVRIQSKNETEGGVDFLVAVDEEGEPLSTRLLVVQVKGTTSSDKAEWMQGVKELFQIPNRAIYLPACVVVVNVRDNRAFYAWVAEPLVVSQGAKLRFLPPGEFHDLDRPAVDRIVERIKAWYDVLHRQFVPATN
jgi:hypothetical protein